MKRKAKKKILHVLFSGLGGHGNVFMSMVDADKEKAFEYSGVFMGIEQMREEYIQKCNDRGIPFHAVLKKIGFDVKAFYRVYKAFKKERPDILFLHASTNIIPAIFYRFSRLFRVKILVRETQPNHLKTRQEWIGMYVAMMVASRMFFLTEQFRDDAKKAMGIFFRKRKSRVIPNGIDLAIFRPAVEPDIVNEPLLLGMQGRLYKTKDHITLLKAISLLKSKSYFPSLQLLIAGEGFMREELELTVKELGISEHVKFLGMLKEDELSVFLQSLGIYIHASNGETMSTAIMQVMACRLPVIASDVKGINNMVNHNQNGLLVPVRNAEAMALAIDELYHDHDLRRKFAAAGYQYAMANFSNEKMWTAYKEEFDKA